MINEPRARAAEGRRVKKAKEKSKARINLLVIILTVITVLPLYLLFNYSSSIIPLSKSDFITGCQFMPSYEAVLSHPSDFKSDLVKVNLYVEQVFDNGDYRCIEDANGDFVYDGNEYYVIDRRGAFADAFEKYDAFTAYCVIAGTKQVIRNATGETVTLVKLNLKYVDPAPIATPTPKPTPKPTPEPTPTQWPTETLDIDGEIVTAYVVDLRNYEWDQFGEFSDSKVEITKNVNTYPTLLKGAIENCYGIKIRRYSAESKKGNPFDVQFKGVVRLRDGKWSSGEQDNVFDYIEGTEVDVYILFIHPTSISAVDIVPTKGQKRECSWSPTWYSPVLYFATIEDATRYINSIS